MKRKDLPSELTEPIKLTGRSEGEKVRELHEQRLKKAHLLLDLYDVPEDLMEDPAQQWWWLAVTLAKEQFPGFTVASDDGRPEIPFQTKLKFYCEVRRLMQRQGLSQKKALLKLVDDAVAGQQMHRDILVLCEDEPITDDVPPPAIPDFLQGYVLPTDAEAAHDTLRRRFYAAQKELKERCQTSCPDGQYISTALHYHGAAKAPCPNNPCKISLDSYFEDVVSLLIYQLDNNPEYFDTCHVEETYQQFVGHCLPT
jgi:hypothetical protein